jgi:hypothetical protein
MLILCVKKRLVPDDILAMLPEECDIAYAGSKRLSDDKVLDILIHLSWHLI